MDCVALVGKKRWASRTPCRTASRLTYVPPAIPVAAFQIAVNKRGGESNNRYLEGIPAAGKMAITAGTEKFSKVNFIMKFLMRQTVKKQRKTMNYIRICLAIKIDAKP